MKKLIGITLAVLMLLGIGAVLYADEDEEDVPTEEKAITVTVKVEDVFAMKIWTSQYDQEIRPADPIIDNRFGHLNMYVYSNRGTAWRVVAKVGAEGGCVGPEGIVAPLMFSTYDVWDEKKGVYANKFKLTGCTFVANLVLTSEDQSIFIPRPDLYYTDGVQIPSHFIVVDDYGKLPPGPKFKIGKELPHGTYTGSLMVTLTE